MLLIRSGLLVVVQLMMSPLAEMELGLPLLAVEMEMMVLSLLDMLRRPFLSERGLGRQIGG